MMWALVIITTLNVTGLPDRISFFESRIECERWAPVEVWHLETTGRAVASARCEMIREPPGRLRRG